MSIYSLKTLENNTATAPIHLAIAPGAIVEWLRRNKLNLPRFRGTWTLLNLFRPIGLNKNGILGRWNKTEMDGRVWSSIWTKFYEKWLSTNHADSRPFFVRNYLRDGWNFTVLFGECICFIFVRIFVNFLYDLCVVKFVIYVVSYAHSKHSDAFVHSHLLNTIWSDIRLCSDRKQILYIKANSIIKNKDIEFHSLCTKNNICYWKFY